MRKNKKLNKKGFTPMEVMIGIIISIISFYLILSFLISNNNSIGTYAQDLQCRATIELQATSSVNTADEITKRAGIDSFTNVLKNKCAVDYLIIKSNEEKEIYKNIADEQTRCWYRYGEGKNDFLSSFQTSGNWCFLCGVAEIKSNENQEYNYNSYVKWLSENEYKKENGKSINYSEYMTVKYTDVSYDELSEIELSLKDILSDNDPAFNSVAEVVIGQYQFLQDMKLKKISTSEPIYIVYRYNRVEKSFEQKMGDATYGAMGGVVGAIFVGAIVEGAVTGGACAISGIGTVVSHICAAGGFVKGIVTGFSKSANSAAKVLRLEKISAKISKMIKSSNTLDKATDISSFSMRGKKFFTFGKVKDFSIDKTSMIKVADDFEKAGEVSRAKNLRAIAEFMDEMKVEDIKDIDKIIFSNEKNLNDLRKLVDNGIDNNMINTEILTKFAAKEGKLVDDIGDYKALRELILEELEKGPPSIETKAAIIDYIRVGTVVSVGGTGAYIGVNINSNSNQYVDIMTKEQYFRLCGTEKKIDERIKKLN